MSWTRQTWVISMRKAGRTRGFTLLELMVAVALFAVLATLAYGGLNQIANESAQLQQQSSRLGDVQRAVDRVVSDLRAARSRPIRDAMVGRLAALVGDQRQIEFTRGGYGNLLSQPRAELERVGYQLRGDQLLRLHYSALDRRDSRPDREDVLLDGVAEFRLGYRDSNGRTVPQWPTGEALDQLPSALQLQLQLDDLGEISRIIELPAMDP